MNERFMQCEIFSHNLSIDEQTVPYFRRYSANTFIKEKPVRLGFKIWCLSSLDGYLLQFIPYGGKGNEKYTTVKHKIYFDNSFINYQLLRMIDKTSYFVTCIVNCVIEETKTFMKKERGSYDYPYDKNSNIMVIK